MDIFMINIPYQLLGREPHLKKDLAPYLETIGILAFHVRIFKNKKSGKLNGNLTVPTREAGGRFLARYGQARLSAPPQVQITVQGVRVCFLPGNREADEYVVRSLLKEQEDIMARKRLKPAPAITRTAQNKFEINRLECGVWSTEWYGNVPVFECYYSRKIDGKLRFGGKDVTAAFRDCEEEEDDTIDHFPDPITAILASIGLSDGSNQKRITMRYLDITSIVVFSPDSSSITVTLGSAPRFYQQLMKSEFGPQPPGMDRSRRLSSLNPVHACFAPFAFVYRFQFKHRSDADSVMYLKGQRGLPTIAEQRTMDRPAKAEFEWSVSNLLLRLQQDFREPGKFNVAFHLQALWANGALPPGSVLRLLPRVDEMVMEIGCERAAEALEMFHKSLEPSSPTYEADLLSDESLAQTLCDCRAETSRGLSPIARNILKAQEDRLCWVNHVMVTPAGCYFYGPRPEPQNRVLRKYPEHHEYFIRVVFCEEDGDQLIFQHRVDQEPIYKGQFLYYLYKGVIIAGRKFEFLGFSSSSLRTQSCWFMAPFWHNGELLDVEKVKEALGNFSNIRCPGKCAARIGQAFSDTVNSIHVHLDDELEIPDVKRNGRCFSDGVGTISQKMLERIWNQSESLRGKRPNVFQIRFAGAKGVVSLDSRLEGDKFCLRPSMIKFDGSNDRNIEICSSPDCLPLYLNRPLIKVLEDIGVAESTFTTLQGDAVEVLRRSTRNPLHAANFLKQRLNVPAVRLPWVIEALHNIGLSFRNDYFLEQAFELVLITSLRDLKHRGRIPVPQGMTLIGIMDETGFLEEGEIYCAVQGHGRNMNPRTVLVTRSPCHHPGDVQLARAVGVNELPLRSPLRALRNCVVFSQKGERDLPSMLSGGDLDDLYNIIYDARFNGIQTYSPAEYPLIVAKDLGRPVESKDIMDFFIEFMQNNLLGIISTKHLIIADQQEAGVHHKNCLKLAQLASTAVDFPKTGKKVDKSEIPRCSPTKPDFMAPGPRILIKGRPELDDGEEVQDSDDEDTPTRYYTSHKVLGKLYRAIDETAFLREVQSNVYQSRSANNVDEGSVVQSVWEYLRGEIPECYDWKRYIPDAEALKDIYEKNVETLMIDYSDTPWKHKLREVEVFIGCIVGRERQTRRQRENSACMRDQYNRITSSIVESMKGDSRDSTLGWGMASLSLCLPGRNQRNRNPLKSFAWVAISVLLTEVDKMQKEAKEAKKPSRR